MVPPGRDPQFVLEHSGFVRELVRRLVFDPELARDVEQETWLAALKHEGPARGSERSWLATIARNLARRAWRSKARREERELDPPPQPITPTPAEILEREALRREVVEALLALDEPWRETLVLHFLEELPAQTIAERLAVPLETVRTRIKRGLELLRARLERRTHLHGAALSLALVEAWRISPPPFAALAASVPSLTIGAVLMSTATKSLLAVAAVLALVAAFRFTTHSEPASPLEPVAAMEAQDAPKSPQEAVEGPVDDSASRTELAQEPVAIAAGTPASEAKTGTVIVRAKWLPDGEPARGIGFDLHSSGAVDFYRDALRHWTDAEGVARVENVAPGRVSAYSERGSYAQGEVKAGETTEIALELPEGFVLTGRVLDVDGTPVAGADVYLWQCFNDADQGWVVARSDERGAYSVRGLSKMLNFLSARAKDRAPTKQRLVMANEGSKVTTDLVFEAHGGALRGRVLDTQGQPVEGATVIVGGKDDLNVPRFPDGGEARAPAGQRLVTDANGQFEVAGVETGDVKVRARGGELAPWTGTVAIDAGRTSTLEIRLSVGGRLEGLVRDDTGKPVARAEVTLGNLGALESAYRKTAADGSFVMEGLAPGEFTVNVDHNSFGSTTSTATIVDGATQRLELVLRRGLTLRVHIGGELAPWIGGNVQANDETPGKVNYFRSLTIDASGVVEFTQCPEAPLKLQLYAPSDFLFPRATLDGVRASDGDVWFQPDPSRVGNVRLRGRIVDADGQPLGSARIMPGCPRAPMSPIESCDGKTGRFDIGFYMPGEWSIRAEATGYVSARTPFATVANGETHDFGDIVMQRGAVLRVTGLGAGPDVRAWVENSADELLWLEHDGSAWTSSLLPEGTSWLVTGGGDVALSAQRVTLLAGTPLEVHIAERKVEPCELRVAAALAARVTGLGVRDANGVSLGLYGFDAESGLARIPLAPGRYEIQFHTADAILGQRTLEVGGERAAGPIELALD